MNATPPAQARLTAYVADIAADLSGPRPWRERILDELRDGLDQAVARHTAAGAAADRAVAAAIEEFGRPHTVADAFAGELAVGYARRSVAWFIATGPLVGVWWLLLLESRPWRTGVVALLAAVPVAPLIVAAIVTSAATLATTGRLMRWVPEASPRRALTATVVVAALAFAADLVVLVLFGGSVGARWPLGVIAVTASLTRMACSVRTVHRATGLRKRLAGARG